VYPFNNNWSVYEGHTSNLPCSVVIFKEVFSSVINISFKRYDLSVKWTIVGALHPVPCDLSRAACTLRLVTCNLQLFLLPSSLFHLYCTLHPVPCDLSRAACNLQLFLLPSPIFG
jgi:hypothetical protein